MTISKLFGVHIRTLKTFTVFSYRETVALPGTVWVGGLAWRSMLARVGVGCGSWALEQGTQLA